MSKADKTLEKMRNNPRDWQLAHLEIVAGRFGITVRRGKGSHVSFTHSKWIEILTVPAHRPVKPIYVKKFVSLIDAFQEEEI
jgi:predicted RNA binding protein YcfA (HicA-like mRNA interferase family)